MLRVVTTRMAATTMVRAMMPKAMFSATQS